MRDDRTRACADFVPSDFVPIDFVPANFAMTNNIRYAARLSRKPISGRTITRAIMTRKPTVAIVGAGSLATFLAVALNDAGFTIAEIIARATPRSRRRARSLAAK